ncbi:MAG: GTP-binding protein [Candidatus Aenigmatarchaeota archaeon]|nr:MAG: GTP-binding protein [Candidatus Aenigmarchaeota archaeon]
MTRQEEIKKIEEELEKTKYNKHTQGHIGMLKAKLAKLRAEVEKGSGTSYGPGFSVKKSGDATVLLVGFPSVGKSTLLNRLTNADSKTGHYDFTTLDVIPGMMVYKGAKIQILDIPGLIADAAKGTGKGKRVLSALRSADLIIFLLDDVYQLEPMRKELYNGGFRLDRQPPDVKIVKKDTGGLKINIAVRKPILSKASVKRVLGEFRIHNADVLIRENIDEEQLIDSLMKNRAYVPSLVVLNKIDIMLDFSRVTKDIVKVSAERDENLDDLREAIWKKLGLIRLYMKRIGHDPDMKEPLIMKDGCTVMGVAKKILRGQEKYFKHARIWGPSARFPEQKVGPYHKLRDKDIVELHA